MSGEPPSIPDAAKAADAEARARGRVAMFNSRRPDGLDGWTMDARIHELMRAHLHRLLARLGDEDGWVPLRTVVDAAQAQYHDHPLFPKGRVRNYCTFTKVDLEARGEIERAPGRAAQRIRLTEYGARASPYLDSET
jgi:hypothetical protein